MLACFYSAGFGPIATLRACMFLPTSLQTQVLVWSVVIHVVADWLLQTDWMATNKRSLRHPAAWAHSGVHCALLLLIFSWPLALLVALTHLLIDTRVPVHWWMLKVKRIPEGSPAMSALEIWMDQVFHFTVLAVVACLFFQ